MAFISKEYVDALKEGKLLDNQDVNNISDLTKEKGIRNGKGYSRNHIRNFLYHQHTTTDDMVKLILDYFSAKKLMRENLVQKQESFTQQLKEEVV